MPITLNHSNIGVQYNTGSNYIIETVKSDLYLRDTRTDITSNLLAEPTVLSPVFTETIRTFVHSGGTEEQTSYTITVGQNTICDILIVGGGGGGGGGHGGGGGAGQLVLIHQATLSGTYTIKVGKGGNGTILDNIGVTTSAATKGGNSEFGSVIAEGGGANGGSTLKDGGSGAGGDGYTPDGAGVAGKGLKNTTIDTFPSGIVYSKGNDGGNAGSASSGQGGGGGGAGAVGTAGGATGDSAIGHGGDGLSGISEINYDFKTNFGNYGKLEADGKYWFAGGGAGGVYYVNSSVISNGGKGGGGSTPASVAYAKINGGVGMNGTGGGGAGGSAWYGSGGNGGSGIVIIKFKTIVNAAIPEGNPITHKTLNFVYEPRYPTISVDNTNLKAWYKFDGNYEDSSGSGFNLTNSGAVIVDGLIVQSVSTDASDFLQTSAINLAGKTYSISFWAKLNTTPSANAIFFQQGITGGSGLWLSFFYHQTTNTLRFSHYGSGNDIDTTGYNISSMIGTSWHHYVATYNNTNRAGEIWFDGVKLNTNISTLTNVFSGSGNFNIARSESNIVSTLNGLMEDFRYYDKVLTSTEISQLYNIPTQNTYTLNFPVPTIADINNNSNIVLRGTYDIALSSMNSSIIPKSNQYIPKPTSFTNYSIERMYPPVRNFTAATTAVSGQTYGNGTYIVSFSSTLGGGLDPWACFNTSGTSGGHWASSRYTSGVFNSTSFIVAGYLGDWIKIQLPVAIKLTRFEFLMRNEGVQAFRDRAPKDFKIYGSNDNITWVELVNKTDAVYDSSFRYIQLTQDIITAYTYYGLVVNKLLGSTADTLNFDEWYIYGQEVLPSSLSIRYNLLNPVLDPSGAQWTYNSSNTNVYHMGNVGIGTKSPEYSLDVSGSVNAKMLMYNGSSVNSLGLSIGMIAQVQHLTYTKMEEKNNTGWDAINEDLASGFVIKITPKSSLSKMLVNLIVFIGMSTSADNAWWGIKLYRKIGTGSWTEITGCNGTETGSGAATAGTPVWISNNTGMVSYNESITNASGTYLDSPNTTATVYYTAYWNQRLGDNPSATGNMFLNRAANQNDAYRPAPSSSWTVEEIWYG